MPDTERRTFRDWFEESATDPLVFLLGVQGSGTNLTARILQSVFEYTAVLDGSLIFNGALQVERRPTRAVIVREFERIHRRLFPGPWRRRIAIRHYHHRNEGFRGIEQHFDPQLISRTLLPLLLPTGIGHTIDDALLRIPQKVGRFCQSDTEPPAGVTAR